MRRTHDCRRLGHAMRRTACLPLLFLLGAVLATPVSALEEEEIVLKDGTVIHGRVFGKTSVRGRRMLRVETDFGVVGVKVARGMTFSSVLLHIGSPRKSTFNDLPVRCRKTSKSSCASCLAVSVNRSMNKTPSR